MERSLVLIKPDAVERGLVGEIVSRVERKGLKLVGLKIIQMSDRLLADHYAHIADRDFYPELAQFMSRTPIVAMCVEGLDCVATLRRLCGVTRGSEADPGTIRGDFALSVQSNLVHASDSLEAAEEEIRRFFGKDEIYDYSLSAEEYTYSSHEGS